MDEIYDALNNLNAGVVLGIAGALAALFVALVFYTSYRENRKPKRKNAMGGSEERAPGFMRRMRHLVADVKRELARRKKHAARMKEREP